MSLCLAEPSHITDEFVSPLRIEGYAHKTRDYQTYKVNGQKVTLLTRLLFGALASLGVALAITVAYCLV